MIFTPRIVGNFLFGIAQNGDSKWFRCDDISSLQVVDRAIYFKLGEHSDAEIYCAGEARTERDAQQDLFNLLTALSAGGEDQENG